MLEIFWHCRDNGVVPNVTINGWGLTDEWAFKLAEVCGAVAVSRYDNKDVCYSAVKRLTDAGLTQVNIHQLVSEETYNNCVDTVKDIVADSRLEKLNAIVFLSLKRKGRGEGYTVLSHEKYDGLISLCLDTRTRFGMDSCSAHKFLDFLERHPKYDSFNEQLRDLVEPCESTLFSIYINVDGEVVPCSFCEGIVQGINILEWKNFLQDIWYGHMCRNFRDILNLNGRKCPVYKV
jgi:MoaA/NifB/PqqE/SkfB family radical SAM enzyme